MAGEDKDVVELGFVEKSPAWKLHSKFFPSKVGGWPSWLALKGLPSPEELTCYHCKKPLIFLCQVYAPFHEKDDCFHRTMFVFVCRDPDCCQDNKASNIRVFRSQLARINEFYSKEPSKEVEAGAESPGAGDFSHLCRVCGALGPKTCGGCKAARYCSKDHQALDWKGGHKAECKIQSVSRKCPASTAKLLFPEYEIELEPEEQEAGREKSEEEVMKEYEDLLRSGYVTQQDDDDSDTETDLVNMATKETDKQFQKFRTRIKDYPDQILRYDRGGEPLWVSSSDKGTQVPDCPACGAPRQFEFQVMPQLLVHLKVDSAGQSLDWGTVLVYSCTHSCLQDRPYLEELVLKQDYAPMTQVMKS
ncbi:Programmed cell death protein 2 [Chionoecetes opilio]|uniref:Programmed cell death protein 2 n=1 Tax=Chionoecetes opilio TaxID=41210 RepID=A0A8J4XZG5_CHIOP|nr:Programmed cell death protein 2 [Chionoecetes opilio]